MPSGFDIVVIGGGHAGAEAAWAAGRTGAATALVTLSAGSIAAMSCNPAIGGIGKGQIVREIDALGGLMGLAADATAMQFRMLNRSKGPAVWGPRCQTDRHAYSTFVRRALEGLPNLTIIEGEAVDLVVEGGRVAGVRVAIGGRCNPAPEAHPFGGGHDMPAARLNSPKSNSAGMAPGDTLTPGPLSSRERGIVDIPCRAAVVTTGTFLRGVMHRGEDIWAGGRYDEPAAGRLSEALERAGLRLGRLKTGTCPRIAAGSVDYRPLARQDGDAEPAPFSFMTGRVEIDQVPCWLTATNEAVHGLIRENFGRAPLFTGQIASAGPRYCPSLELKVRRFPEKASHPVFLEPEGRGTDWVYLNGVSTSLPVDVQERIVRLLPGLAGAEVRRWGYAIEYDFAPPTQLRPTLEAKAVAGLFLAGQINGTTGYEEAAGQGLVAGVNAAAAVAGRAGLVLRRDQAYIGVMIDDLVTKGVEEPYRMFTSRAERRLLLRADNADRRLTPVGREAGLVEERRWRAFEAKREAVERAGELLGGIRADGASLAERLAGPKVEIEGLLAGLGGELRRLWSQRREAVLTAAIDCRYAGYVAREEAAAGRLAALDARRIPARLDYAAVPHLRAEAAERLAGIRPETLGQALRVSGITPADVTVLMIHLGGGKSCEYG